MMKLRIVLAATLLAASFACGSSYSSPAAPSPSPSPTPSPTQTGTPVSIVAGASTKGSTAFAPNPIAVAVGGTVTWTNADNIAHTSTGASWDSGAIPPGGKFSMTFASAGSFPYRCTIHPGMVGTVTVQ